MRDISRAPWPTHEKNLAWFIEHDKQVGKRGTPSLPKLKFMEGLGPEDPRFDAQSGSNAEAGGLDDVSRAA